MSEAEHAVPEAFGDLAPYVREWALATEPARYRRRLSSTLDEARVFYDAIAPRMGAVMDHLQSFPANDVAALPVAVRNLFHLALAYFEVSHPIELRWRSTDLDDAFPADRIVYQDPSDRDH